MKDGIGCFRRKHVPWHWRCAAEARKPHGGVGVGECWERDSSMEQVMKPQILLALRSSDGKYRFGKQCAPSTGQEAGCKEGLRQPSSDTHPRGPVPILLPPESLPRLPHEVRIPLLCFQSAVYMPLQLRVQMSEAVRAGRSSSHGIGRVTSAECLQGSEPRFPRGSQH